MLDVAWSVNGKSVEPGTRTSTSIQIGTMSDGSPIEIKVILINGAEEGPTAYAGGGVHGDEVTSTATVARFGRELDPTHLRGRVIAVPAQSPLAFRAHHRLAIQLLHRSPMDQFATDPFMHFPGRAEGNYGELVAAHLFELIKQADALFDLHTPTTGGRYVPFVFLPPPSVPSEIYKRSIELANAYSPDFILKTDSGVYVGEGTAHVAAARAGIPGFGFEVGEGGHLQPDGVERGLAGLRNALRHLRMLPGSAEVLGPCRIVSSMTPVRAVVGGIWELETPLGVDVVQGERMGVIRNLEGDIVHEVRAPHAGPFMRATTFGSVASGERLVQIGVEAS